MGGSIDCRPLEGIKVVELSTVVTVGSCGRIPTDWGAEAIKVENAGGDMFRSFPETFFIPCTVDEDLLFDNLNVGERGVVLNLKTLGGMDAMYRLLVDADILLTNIRPRALERLGLDYASLREAYPKLIMVNASGFEEKRPKKDNPGFNTIVFRVGSDSNVDMMVDGPDNYPVYSSAGSGDIVTAMGLYYAITATLCKKNQTGLGDHASSFLYGTAL